MNTHYGVLIQMQDGTFTVYLNRLFKNRERFDAYLETVKKAYPNETFEVFRAEMPICIDDKIGKD